MIYLFLNNHNYLLMGCVCLLRMHSFSDLRIWLDITTLTSSFFLKKYLFICLCQVLAAARGTFSCKGDPAPWWGVRLGPALGLRV